MEDRDIIHLCIEVLDKIVLTGWENDIIDPIGQLIFPAKSEDIRISEQELKQLFIDQFKEKHKTLFYSIESPTRAKYNLGKNYEQINICNEINNIIGQAALIDMSILKKSKETKKYIRILNIEFKHQNAPLKDIGKDVLKLIHESEKGVFIFLLDNTNKGSLNNESLTRKGVLDKLKKSFDDFKEYWDGDKSVLLVIMSLKEKVLIHRSVSFHQIADFEKIFSINTNGYGNIRSVSENSGWKLEVID
ncbi:hypothetical protein [Flavobacterium sp. SM2513]|uniref:hypothetical protein n=1 Tax=Flavobacterium sp. SM2513 TaxID=3424766 RepID=UPI003D7F640C